MEDKTSLRVVDSLGKIETEKVAFLHNHTASDDFQLNQIITSPMSKNSDIIYLYTKKGVQNGTDV